MSFFFLSISIFHSSCINIFLYLSFYMYFFLTLFLTLFLCFLYPLSVYFIRYLSINVFHYLPFYMSLFISLYLSFILSLTPTLSLSSNTHGSLTYFTTTKINVQTGRSYLKCRISTLSNLVRYQIQTINLTYGTDQLSGGRTGSSMHTTLLQQQLSGALYVLPKHALSHRCLSISPSRRHRDL